MPELEISDDILAPSDKLKLRFKGKNPFIVMTMVPGLLKDGMKISSKDVLETDIRWDITGEMRDFYGMWLGRRQNDRWTKTEIRVIIQGAQSAQDKTGNVYIEIKGSITTKYEYSNFIQRGFWWLFNKTFYYNQRYKQIEDDKDTMFEIRKKFMDALGIVQES